MRLSTTGSQPYESRLHWRDSSSFSRSDEAEAEKVLTALIDLFAPKDDGIGRDERLYGRAKAVAAIEKSKFQRYSELLRLISDFDRDSIVRVPTQDNGNPETGNPWAVTRRIIDIKQESVDERIRIKASSTTKKMVAALSQRSYDAITLVHNHYNYKEHVQGRGCCTLL